MWKRAEACCPFDDDSEAKWRKNSAKSEFVKPISTSLDIGVDIRWLEKVDLRNSNSIRFECHMFNSKARKSKGKFKPTKCTIKSGDHFHDCSQKQVPRHSTLHTRSTRLPPWNPLRLGCSKLWVITWLTCTTVIRTKRCANFKKTPRK